MHVHELESHVRELKPEDVKLLTTIPTHISRFPRLLPEVMQGLGIGADRIKVIPSFLPSEYPIARERPQRSGRFTIGGCGYPGWYKGADLWLHVAQTLLGRGLDYRFVWLGLTSDTNGWRVKAMAEKNGHCSRNRTHWGG